MNTRLKREVIELAEKSPIEVCGFMCETYYEPQLYPCVNVAANPVDEFEISEDDHANCFKVGQPIAVYHSHPTNEAGFTDSDLANVEEVALPHYMYHVPSKTWHEYIPKSYQVKLEGRRFIWGFEDCYGICRHYYRQEHGLYLSDYDRDSDFSNAKTNSIMENFEREGFRVVPISQMRVGDGMLFDLKKRCPEHLGVYLGRNQFLHHKIGGLSHVDAFDEHWVKGLVNAFRHRTLE